MENDATYASLAGIQARRMQLKSQIDDSSVEVQEIWDEIFHPKKPTPKTPVERALSIATSSAGLIDGALFGWKLYRKLTKKSK